MVEAEDHPTPDLQPAEPPPAERPIAPHWLRLALAVEFVLALIAATVVWEEVGGQGHLDLMPWYLKLLLMSGFCWSVVRFTAAIAQPGTWRTRRALRWLCAVLGTVAVMGLVTYYYHLHEPADEDDDDSDTPTSVSVPHQPAPPRPI